MLEIIKETNRKVRLSSANRENPVYAKNIVMVVSRIDELGEEEFGDYEEYGIVDQFSNFRNYNETEEYEIKPYTKAERKTYVQVFDLIKKFLKTEYKIIVDKEMPVFKMGVFKSSNIRGAFDPETNSIVVSKGLSDYGFKETIAHELIHYFSNNKTLGFINEEIHSGLLFRTKFALTEGITQFLAEKFMKKYFFREYRVNKRKYYNSYSLAVIVSSALEIAYGIDFIVDFFNNDDSKLKKSVNRARRKRNYDVEPYQLLFMGTESLVFNIVYTIDLKAHMKGLAEILLLSSDKEVHPKILRILKLNDSYLKTL